MRRVLKTAECHIHVTHCYGSDKNRLVFKFIIRNSYINALYHGPRTP